MRIALTNSTTWPRVQRGAERFMNELAAYLGQRGHEVTVISGKPGRTEVRQDRGYTTILRRRLWHPVLAKIGWLEFHSFFFTALYSFLTQRYDAILCCTFSDAFAARVARRITKVPYVFWVNGLPPRIRYFRSLTTGGAIFKRAVQGADAVVAFSGYVEDYIQQRWGTGSVRIPIPVDTSRFRLVEDRNGREPVILCAAAIDDRRKGARLLVRAFNRLKATRPSLKLQLGYKVNEGVRDELASLADPEHRNDIVFSEPTSEQIADTFGRATLSVLPSLWEAFGMVILESMATGTPVVGTRDGAIPELISNPAVGRMFDPGSDATVEPTNLNGLVEAIEETLKLADRPETAANCRRHAEQFSWPQLGPRFESLFEQIIVARRGKAAKWSASMSQSGTRA